MKISEKLYSLRKQKGLSQEELAGMLNVSRQTISKWETGESNPDFDKIEPLCEIYDISADELIRNIKIGKNEDDSKDKETGFKEYKEWKKHEGIVLASCIFLFFVAIVWIILISTSEMVNEGFMVSIFMIICGVATSILIWFYVTLGNKKKYVDLEITNAKKENKYKKYDRILAKFFCIIYLLVSFLTMAWEITWIIWCVYALVIGIVHIILDEKEDKNENK